MIRKIFLGLIASISLNLCCDHCEASEIFYSAEEISDMIYEEYILSNDMIIDCVFHDEYKYLQGYSNACLYLYKKINIIED